MGKAAKRLPSPAMIVAVIALIAALAGSAYAAKKLNGTKLVNRSVSGKKLKQNTVSGKEVKEGTLTGVSASSLASVQYVSSAVALVTGATNGNATTANCPAGTKVIGGGATVSSEAADFVNDSFPNATRTGWTATGFGSTGTTMTVTAICTAVTASTG